MTGYGFNDDDEPQELPKLLKKRKTVSKTEMQTVGMAGQELGFVSRTPTPQPRNRRLANREPQGKILVTGPERVLEKLRDLSISTNQPYWKVIEDLMANSSG